MVGFERLFNCALTTVKCALAYSSLFTISIVLNEGKMSSSNNIDETLSAHMATELTFTQDRKEETLSALKEDVEAALDKEVKALDADAWKFAAPRSQIHLISRVGSQSSRWLESTRQELMQTENFHKVDT